MGSPVLSGWKDGWMDGFSLPTTFVKMLNLGQR